MKTAKRIILASDGFSVEQASAFVASLARRAGRLRFRFGLILAAKLITLFGVSDPLAYFITWSCYGNWLHGDERGSVDRDHNLPGTPWLEESQCRRRHETRMSRQPPLALESSARRIVADTIRAHCLHRDWDLLAVNVRSNHVHVVVSGPPSADRALIEFKAWATRRLREAGLVTADRRVWTDHGSTRYLWKSETVEEKIDYVLHGQGDDLD